LKFNGTARALAVIAFPIKQEPEATLEEATT